MISKDSQSIQRHFARVDANIHVNKQAIAALKRDDSADRLAHDALSANIKKLSSNLNLIFKRLGQVESLIWALSPYKEYRSKIDDENALGVLANKFGYRDVLSLEPVGGVFDEKVQYEPLEFERSNSSSSSSSSFDGSGRDSDGSSRDSDYGSITAKFSEK
jgi:hypothetical protein